jgi:hypothetical protein
MKFSACWLNECHFGALHGSRIRTEGGLLVENRRERRVELKQQIEESEAQLTDLRVNEWDIRL